MENNLETSTHPTPQNSPSVILYSDYRTYLADYVAWKRATSRAFSVRAFCLKAGVSTENYLLRIIRGQKNLGPKLAERFSEAIGLKERESRYFFLLAQLGQSKNLRDQKRILETLDKLRRNLNRGQVLTPQIIDNSMIRHWYFGAILELASCPGFKLSPQSAADALQGRISVQEAKEAIEFLVQKKYLISAKGRLTCSPNPISSTDNVPDAMVRLAHQKTLEIAAESVELPLEERSFRGLTLAFEHKRMPEAKEMIREFVDKFQERFALDPKADRVYRMQVQCFPLSVKPSSPRIKS